MKVARNCRFESKRERKFFEIRKLDESCREDCRVSLLLNVSRKIGRSSRVT